MERHVKGIAIKIFRDYAILMTKDGEFIKVRKPSKPISLGDEIISSLYEGNRYSRMLRYTAVAAVILLLLIPFIYFREAYATVAYVNLDINPSVELGINRYNKVNNAKALNEDGLKLLKTVSVNGLDIEVALAEIITAAKEDGYIDEENENCINIALIKMNEDLSSVTDSVIMQYARHAVVNTDVDAIIQVYAADREIREKAIKENISTNTYIEKVQGQGLCLREQVRRANGPADVNTDNGVGEDNINTINQDNDGKGNANAGNPGIGNGKTGESTPGQGSGGNGSANTSSSGNDNSQNGAAAGNPESGCGENNNTGNPGYGNGQSSGQGNGQGNNSHQGGKNVQGGPGKQQ